MTASWYKPTLLATLLLGIHFVVLASSTIDTTDSPSPFQLLDEGKKCYESTPGNPLCADMLLRAYDLSGHHAYFLEDIVSFLMAQKDYQGAREYVFIDRIDTLPLEVQARHHHFRGLIMLQDGFDQFTQAFYEFRKAYFKEIKSPYPTFKFLSQTQNAMGYTRMIYGGPNQDGPEDYPHTNWITSDLLASLRHFEQALYFDDENENARINRDTLYAKILMTGRTFHEIQEMSRPKPIETIRAELLINEKSENDTLDEININYLPNNVAVILSTLQQYDELLVAADISGSMEDIHPVKNVDRFKLMQELILYLFHHMVPTTQCGIVSVGRSCGRLPVLFYPVDLNARKDIMDTLRVLRPDGYTPLSFSITKAKQLYSKKKNRKALFLISDGMETCDDPMDLCLVASDLHALGVDIHIISFIVEGMEDYEMAYEIYNCMAQYSSGKVFEFDENILEDKTEQPDPMHDEILLLPPISIGDNLRGIMHFVVDLTRYFENTMEKE